MRRRHFKTEHAGPKRGKGPMRKAEVKSASRKLRRGADRAAVADGGRSKVWGR